MSKVLWAKSRTCGGESGIAQAAGRQKHKAESGWMGRVRGCGLAFCPLALKLFFSGLKKNLSVWSHVIQAHVPKTGGAREGDHAIPASKFGAYESDVDMVAHLCCCENGWHSRADMAGADPCFSST